MCVYVNVVRIWVYGWAAELQSASSANSKALTLSLLPSPSLWCWWFLTHTYYCLSIALRVCCIFAQHFLFFHLTQMIMTLDSPKDINEILTQIKSSKLYNFNARSITLYFVSFGETVSVELLVQTEASYCSSSWVIWMVVTAARDSCAKTQALCLCEARCAWNGFDELKSNVRQSSINQCVFLSMWLVWVEQKRHNSPVFQYTETLC